MKREIGVRFSEEGREWRLPCLLHADELVLCSKLENDLNVIVGRFAELCKRRSLEKKIYLMVLGEKQGSTCKLFINKT